MINNMPECPFKRGQVFKNPDDALMMVVRVTLFVNGWVVYYVTDDNQKGHFNQNNTDIIHNIELLALTPPQSPNRAVLDALKNAQATLKYYGISPLIKVDEAIAAATQADEVNVIDGQDEKEPINGMLLDALKSVIFDIECLEPIKKTHLDDAYKAISLAETNAVWTTDIEIREFISEQFKEDGTPYIAEEKNCILLGMPVDANTADWFTKLRAFEHLKRQKGQ